MDSASRKKDNLVCNFPYSGLGFFKAELCLIERSVGFLFKSSALPGLESSSDPVKSITSCCWEEIGTSGTEGIQERGAEGIRIDGSVTKQSNGRIFNNNTIFYLDPIAETLADVEERWVLVLVSVK